MGNYMNKTYQYLLTDFIVENENVPQDPTGEIQKVQEVFYFTEDQIIELYRYFRTMDHQGTGFINLDNLFVFIKEELNSMVSPYLERLFILIKKKNINKITFCEWLPAISSFCLYTDEQIYQFVFNMLDSNQDSFISKKDLIDFLSAEKFNQQIFPSNFLNAIENMEISRSDRINFDQFKKYQSQIPFICFPAFRLQQELKYYVKGEQFWKKQFKIIRAKHDEMQKNKQQETIAQQKNITNQDKIKKKQILFNQKVQRPKENQSIHDIENRKYLRRRRPSFSYYEITKVFNNKNKMVIKKQKSELYLKKDMVFSNNQKNDQLNIQNVIQQDEQSQIHTKQKSKLDSIIRPLEVKQKTYLGGQSHHSKLKLFLYEHADNGDLGIEKNNDFIELKRIQRNQRDNIILKHQ